MSNMVRNRMTTQDVIRAYNRWASFYDKSFASLISHCHRKMMKEINQCSGRVLDIGVGTGIQLPYYGRHLEVIGIDLSPTMLEQARQKVLKHKLAHVKDLIEGDAAQTNFPDGHFRVISAAFVMSVVPDPQAVLKEIDRILQPQGDIFILNHFCKEKGFRRFIEKMVAPLCSSLGWHSDMPIEEIIDNCQHSLISRHEFKPFGFFTMLRFRKVT